MSRPSLGQCLRPLQVPPSSGPAAVPSQGGECGPDLSFSDQLLDLLAQEYSFFLPEGCWGELKTTARTPLGPAQASSTQGPSRPALSDLWGSGMEKCTLELRRRMSRNFFFISFSAGEPQSSIPGSRAVVPCPRCPELTRATSAAQRSPGLHGDSSAMSPLSV